MHPRKRLSRWIVILYQTSFWRKDIKLSAGIELQYSRFSLIYQGFPAFSTPSWKCLTVGRGCILSFLVWLASRGWDSNPYNLSKRAQIFSKTLFSLSQHDRFCIMLLMSWVFKITHSIGKSKVSLHVNIDKVFHWLLSIEKSLGRHWSYPYIYSFSLIIISDSSESESDIPAELQAQSLKT
jgi:hypothetical protein